MGAFVWRSARGAARILASIALAFGFSAASSAVAAALTVLVDLDNNPATGCSVATPNGAFDGVSQRFITTVDTTQNPPRVTGITREDCTAAPGTFSAPVSVSGGGWPVGLGNGTGGYDVIETGLPIGTPGPVRVAVIYSDPAIGTDAVTVGTAGGPIIVFSHAPGHIEQVPTLSDAMLVILTLLMVGLGWKYGRRHFTAAPLAVVALVMVTTIAWAAILLDGLTGDWLGIPPVASDGVDAPDGADISAVFGTIEGTTLFMRVDARLGRPPAAVADSYTAVSGTPLTIAAAAGVLANDNAGIPAATVTSFGGGSVGGTVTTNAAGGTATFGVGGSLSVAGPGNFTYTPATGFTGAFTFSYRITNLNGTSDATVTINTQAAPAITSANATTFNVGTAGTFTVTATGFPAPTLSMTGALPAGVTFNTATGVLAGTPTAAGTFPLVFTATNGVAPNATQNFTLTVTQTVAITSANNATFSVGTAGPNFTITTSATPTATLITTTALPAGLSLGATSGTGTAVISGTPTGPGGVFTITITASNGGVTPNGTQTFTLTVNEAPLITSVNAATFQVGTAGTHTVVATGFPVPTLSVTGALPAGVTFDTATGVLAGTATAAGTFPLVFTAANGVGTNATQSFTLTVNQTVAITSANNATFTVGTAGPNFTITTSATPTATSITTTPLPPGLSLGATSGTGTAIISGTPTGPGGVFTITITASNGGVTPNGTQIFTLTVNEAPLITSVNNATFTVGTAGTFTVTATGFPAPTFAIPGLPAGLTLDSTTGAITGTPLAPGGVFNLTITATNGVGVAATQPFTLTVNQAPLVTSAAATTFTVGSPGTFTATASGVPAPSLSFSGVPGGIGVSSVGAVLSGTPLAGSGGIYVGLLVTATNGVGAPATQGFTLTVNEAPQITSANAVTFNVGTPGTFTVTASGFPAPSFTTADALPNGVTLAADGTLSGTPAAGTAALSPYVITLTAANGVLPNGTQNFTLTVTDNAVAVDDNYTVAHDSGVNVMAPSLLANDSGTPGPTVTSVTGATTCTVFPCSINTANGAAIVVQANGDFTYAPAPNFVGDDTFTYDASNAATDTGLATITVTNVLPVVDLNGPAAGIDSAATFTEGLGAVAIVDAAQLTVTDVDDANLDGAIVQITNLLDAGSEILTFTCPSLPASCSGTIQVAEVTYTVATGTLDINPAAAAPRADFEALLRTVGYDNTSSNPTGTPRDITFTLDDGIATNSPVSHAIVTIAGVNQAPTITAPATATAPTNGTLPFAGNVSVADPDAGTSDVQVTLTATNGTVTLSGTAGLTVVPGPGPATTITATGPIASINAALNGMTFTPTPAYSGAATLQIDVSDLGNTGSGGPLTDTHTVNITVDARPAVTTTVPVNGATDVATTSTITVNFTESVTFTGASFTLSCSVSGAQTFTLSASPSASVVITPDTALPAGESCTVTVVAANVTDPLAQTMTVDHVFSFGVNTRPTVTSTTPANGASGVALAANVTVTFSEAVTATGASFTLSCTTSGVHTFALGGTAPIATYTLDPVVDFTAGETCTATVLAAQVTDGSGQDMAANHVFSFAIAQPPTITSAASATFVVGQAGTFMVATTGNPTGASMGISHTGALPTGVTFTNNNDGTATIAGTPASGEGGAYPIMITASNGISPDATQNFTLTVNQAPQITSTNAATFQTQVPGTFTVTTTGFPTNASMGITHVGALPVAVTFVNNNNGTATLSGTPNAGTGGSYPITITANNGVAPNATQTFTLTVNQPPAFTSAASTDFTVGTAGTFTFTASGFPGPSFTAVGTLPTGVSYAAPTLSGTPTQLGAFPLTVTASNGIGLDAVQNPFTLNVVCPTITVSGAALPDGLFGIAYANPDYNHAGSTGSSGTFGATGLPAGLGIDTSTGTISGTPTTTVLNGAVAITYTDNFGCSGTFNTTITIRPVATADSYVNGVGNTQFVVGAATPSTPHVFVSGNVKSNDNGPATLSVTFGAPASGAVVEGATDGTFTYTPNANFAGPTDTFSYTLQDGNGVTNTANVTINLSELVWYVNSGAAGGGDGRSHLPFNTLTPAGTASTTAISYIYVHTGGGNTTGNLTMDTGQELRGQGVSFILNGLSLVAGTRPILTGTVTLASDTLVTGLNFSGASPALTATGLNATLPILIDLVNVTGGSSALSLTNVTATGTGSITFSQATISNTTGAEILVSGGNIPLTFPSTTTISGNSGRLIDIQGRAGNDVLFQSALADSAGGTGIFLSNNGATNFTFSGGITLNGAGSGFTLSNPALAGTLSIIGTNNIGASSAPSVTALSVTNTTIAAVGITFRSIHASGAPSGIVLNNTGNVSGLTVAGDGGVSSNGSGGVIQNSTGIGVNLTSTRNASLNYVNVTGSLDTGIKGLNLTNFTLNRSNVNANGNSTADDGLRLGEASGSFVGATGNVTISNSSISSNAHNNVHIRNTSGTITSLSVTGSTFSSLNDVTGANAFLFEGSGTSVLTAATLSGNTFANNSPQRALEVQSHDTATVGTFTVSGNTFDDNGIHASFTQDTSSNLTFRFMNNGTAVTPMGASTLHALNIFSSANSTGGTIQGRVEGNFIGRASGLIGGNAVRAFIQGRTVATLLIDSNTVRHVDFPGNGPRGFDLQFVGPTATGLPITTSDVTITNNDVDKLSPGSSFPLAAIYLASDNQGSPAAVRAHVSGNNARNSPTGGSWDYPSFDGNGAQLIFAVVTAGATGQLVGSGGATAQLVSNNPATAAARVFTTGITTFAGPINTPP